MSVWKQKFATAEDQLKKIEASLAAWKDSAPEQTAAVRIGLDKANRLASRFDKQYPCPERQVKELEGHVHKVQELSDLLGHAGTASASKLIPTAFLRHHAAANFWTKSFSNQWAVTWDRFLFKLTSECKSKKVDFNSKHEPLVKAYVCSSDAGKVTLYDFAHFTDMRGLFGAILHVTKPTLVLSTGSYEMIVNRTVLVVGAAKKDILPKGLLRVALEKCFTIDKYAKSEDGVVVEFEEEDAVLSYRRLSKDSLPPLLRKKKVDASTLTADQIDDRKMRSESVEAARTAMQNLLRSQAEAQLKHLRESIASFPRSTQQGYYIDLVTAAEEDLEGLSMKESVRPKSARGARSSDGGASSSAGGGSSKTSKLAEKMARRRQGPQKFVTSGSGGSSLKGAAGGGASGGGGFGRMRAKPVFKKKTAAAAKKIALAPSTEDYDDDDDEDDDDDKPRSSSRFSSGRRTAKPVFKKKTTSTASPPPKVTASKAKSSPKAKSKSKKLSSSRGGGNPFGDPFSDFRSNAEMDADDDDDDDDDDNKSDTETESDESDSESDSDSDSDDEEELPPPCLKKTGLPSKRTGMKFTIRFAGNKPHPGDDDYVAPCAPKKMKRSQRRALAEAEAAAALKRSSNDVDDGDDKEVMDDSPVAVKPLAMLENDDDEYDEFAYMDDEAQDLVDLDAVPSVSTSKSPLSPAKKQDDAPPTPPPSKRAPPPPAPSTSSPAKSTTPVVSVTSPAATTTSSIPKPSTPASTASNSKPSEPTPVPSSIPKPSPPPAEPSTPATLPASRFGAPAGAAPQTPAPTPKVAPQVAAPKTSAPTPKVAPKTSPAITAPKTTASTPAVTAPKTAAPTPKVAPQTSPAASSNPSPAIASDASCSNKSTTNAYSKPSPTTFTSAPEAKATAPSPALSINFQSEAQRKSSRAREEERLSRYCVVSPRSAAAAAASSSASTKPVSTRTTTATPSVAATVSRPKFTINTGATTTPVNSSKANAYRQVQSARPSAKETVDEDGLPAFGKGRLAHLMARYSTPR